MTTVATLEETSEVVGLLAVQEKEAKPDMRTRFSNGIAMQPYLCAYSGIISVVSPALTGWQLCRVYSKSVPPMTLARIGLGILPHQTALKCLQMNTATPVKEYASPWLAFGLVGVLQGAVYGQANITFSRALKLSTATVSLAGMFRGSLFAGARDTISQGVPFMLSGSFQAQIVDPLLCPTPTDGHAAEGDTVGAGVRRAVAVICTSIGATFASQGAHNCQIRMQADHALSYSGAVRTLWAEHGPRILYMGGSARIALLLLVNGLNEVLLKKAWAANTAGKAER